MTSSGRRKGKALGAKLLLVGNQDGSWKQNLSGETQLMTGNKNTSSSLEMWPWHSAGTSKQQECIREGDPWLQQRNGKSCTVYQCFHLHRQ